MNAPLYTTEILRLAASLPGPVQLERVDGSAARRSPTCGSSLLTEVQVESGRVEALSQTVLACAFGQASAALVARQAAGHTRDEVATALDQLWIASPPHRQKLLDRGFRRVGVGEAGNLTRLVTADFAG